MRALKPSVLFSFFFTALLVKVLIEDTHDRIRNIVSCY